MKSVKFKGFEYSLVREFRFEDDLDLVFAWKSRTLIDILQIQFRQFSKGKSEIRYECVQLTRSEFNAVSEFVENKESLTLAR